MLEMRTSIYILETPKGLLVSKPETSGSENENQDSKRKKVWKSI